MNTKLFTIEDEPRKTQYDETGFNFIFEQADQLATLKTVYIEAHGRYSKHWQQLDATTARLSKISAEFLTTQSTDDEQALLQEQMELTARMSNLPIIIVSLFKQMVMAHLPYLALEAKRWNREFQILDEIVTEAINSNWAKDKQARKAARKGQNETAATLYAEINQIKVNNKPWLILRGYVDKQRKIPVGWASTLYDTDLTNPGMWPGDIAKTAHNILKIAQRKTTFVPV